MLLLLGALPLKAKLHKRHLNLAFSTGFINHLSVGPGPVVLGQDQLISVIGSPPDQLISMLSAKQL